MFAAVYTHDEKVVTKPSTIYPKQANQTNQTKLCRGLGAFLLSLKGWPTLPFKEWLLFLLGKCSHRSLLRQLVKGAALRNKPN